jgi:hypothetical protein
VTCVHDRRRKKEKDMAKADGVFLYIGTYSSEAAARDDYDIVKNLHVADVVGSYDAAVITKDSAVASYTVDIWG